MNKKKLLINDLGKNMQDMDNKKEGLEDKTVIDNKDSLYDNNKND